jgi:hypothetical protein
MRNHTDIPTDEEEENFISELTADTMVTNTPADLLHKLLRKTRMIGGQGVDIADRYCIAAMLRVSLL